MRGKILGFSIQENKGHISGNDGKQYVFFGQNWKEKEFPLKETEVSFSLDSNGNIIEVSLFRSDQKDAEAVLFEKESSSVIENKYKVMKGVILDFSLQKNKGYILADNGNRYIFWGKDWEESEYPIKNSRVSFNLDLNRDPIEVSSLQSNLSTLQLSSEEAEHASLIADEEKYNVIQWFAKCFRHYVDFSGRARRKEYWYYQLCSIGIIFIINSYIILILRENVESSLVNLFSSLFFCIFFIPDLSVTVRRLHDTGKSGWWSVLSLVGYLYSILTQNYFIALSFWFGLVTLISIFILLILCCIETEPRKNQWGLPAK